MTLKETEKSVLRISIEALVKGYEKTLKKLGKK